MTAISKYVEMKHEFATEMPADLQPHRERVEFARWLVLNGQLTDWPQGQEGTDLESVEPEAVGGRGRKA